MPSLEVLVTFYCRDGNTEHRALAAALGAVQARANIRLRRLTDADPKSSEKGQALARMCKEYVPPTEADILRADALIVAAPAGFASTAPEWTGYLALLSRLGNEEKLKGKIALACAADAASAAALTAALQTAGLIVMGTAASDPTTQGRDLAVHAQALKEARSGR